uniref:Uncharacterized protein n=1 Tax=Leersia perrieri TaxID=77586 RepID=A0A0D9X650_9ORYZ
MERTVRILDRQISQFVAMDGLIWADADVFLEVVDDLISTVQQLEATETNCVLFDYAWIEGDALDLSFINCYFDAVTVGYGLRNVVDKPKELREIFRDLEVGLVL